ncbi:O-antigen ligase family protein [Agromyces atrinae]|uniref:O-antigen ligase family protein n=1 Tax=Agromyces atrinae TaxID=592376 RepID=UPI001F58C09D|nr:O-antigen ligase family protein [Agromyces atrinae]MCI2956077.1 O-antigen ligase family protein [Agromyces atrinae]
MRLFDLAWIVIIASLPVFRTLQAVVGDNLVVLIHSFIVVCVVFRCVRRPIFAPVWVIAAILIPIAGLVAGTATSPVASLRTAIGITIMVGLFPFVARYLVVERRHALIAGVVGFVAVQTVSSVVGIVQAQTGIELFGNIARDGRANGLAGHPNVLALMAMIAVLVSLAALAHVAGRFARSIILISIALNLFALLESGSLSALLVLGVGMIVLLVRLPSLWKLILTVAIVGAVVVLLLAWSGMTVSAFVEETQGRILAVTGEADGMGSWQIRQETWAIGWDRIQSSPLIGWGMDGTNQAVYGSIVVHNVILRAWYQGGFILFAVFALLTLTFLAAIFARRSGRFHPIAAALIAAIWGFAMTSAFYNELHYWVPIILAVALIGPDQDSPHRGALQAPHRGGLAAGRDQP